MLDRHKTTADRMPKAVRDAPMLGSLADAWSQAATRVRAAGDVLATHRDVDGAHRSPTAGLLDEADVRAADLVFLTRLTEVVAADATPLGLRVLQAQVAGRRARRLVPGTASAN
jgi:hypothetical protein